MPAEPLAVLASDLHFSHVQPVARAEPSWYEAQGRYIKQLSDRADDYDAPIIVAGDIFDRWKPVSSPPELINFLLDTLPTIYAICGQHDCPDHRYDQRHRSPYGTLVRAGKIHDLLPDRMTGFGRLCVHGFPWGYPIKPRESGIGDGGTVHLAVVHAYIWTSGHAYPDAPADQAAEYYKPKLAGYDAAVFGDNHRGFMLGCRLINCGTFMRRKSDEKSYRPMIGVLWHDAGTVWIEPHYLDTSGDRWIEESTAESAKLTALDVSGLIESLQEAGLDSLDFRFELNREMDARNVSAGVRRMILESVP